MNTVSVCLSLLFVAMALALCMAWLARQPVFVEGHPGGRPGALAQCRHPAL
jgi:hypothetical protein